MKNGVPFHLAFDVEMLMPHERDAMSIVFSEFEGGKFNWRAWEWEKQE